MIKYIQRSLFRISEEYEYLKSKQIFKSQLQQFKKALNKAIQLQKQIDQNTQAAFNMQNHAFFTSNVPAKTILAAFLQKRDYSNEEIVGQTFVQLGHALKARGDRTYFDHKLIETSMGFDVLIKDLLNLNDYRVLAEAIHGLALTGVYLHSDQIVDKAFQQLEAKELNPDEKQLIEAFLIDIFEEKQELPVDNLIYEVEKLIEETQSDIFNVLEAIVEIRRVYLKLLDIQKSDWVHVNTNIKMMEFEETLISTGLLHPAEIENEDISLSLETALSYISGKDPDLMSFLINILEIQLLHRDQIKPMEPKVSDFGDLMVQFIITNIYCTIKIKNILFIAVSEYKGHEIAQRLKNAQSLLVNSDKYKLSKAFANAGLNVESREYLNQVTDEELLNSKDSLHLHLQLNKTDRQFPIPDNLTLLSLDELIAYATYLALQNQNYGIFIEELKFRVKNLNTIRDLNEKQQERIDVLEKHSGQKLIYEQKDINHSELYKAIKETLPKSVQLIEIYDLSVNNEINGYAKLRVGSQPYMTLYDFLGKDKEQFKQKLQLAFNLENFDIILFNKIKDRLDSVQVEDNSKELNSQTIFNAQWQYLKKRALNYLNKNDNLNKLKLKQTLLDLQERLKILNQNNVFQDLIDEIKVQPIKFPKWYGMIPSQSIYNPQSSIEGFKASLISNRINDPTYCPDQDLFKRLEQNGFISDFIPIPHSDKRRQQIVVQSYSLAWKKHSTKKSDEEIEKLNQLYSFLQKDQKEYHIDSSDLFIANLLNLNAELKSKTLPEIADFVFNIKIWDKLIEERLSSKKSTKPAGIFLQRDPEVLLHEQIKQYNPFLTTQYLKKKLEVNKTLDDLIKMRKELLMKLQEDVKNKEINRKQAQSIVNRINNILHDKIQEIKGELRRKHSSPYYRQKTNYIDILFNENDIEKLDVQQTPDRHLDVDLFSKLFSLTYTRKRSRAEEKLITYYLMNKQMEGKQLNNQELQFLDSLSLYQPNVQVTQLCIKDMQFDDLIHSDFKQFGEFSASDIFLQLSQLFDDQLFLDILRNKYYKKQGIQHHFRRRDNQLYLQQQEKLIWIEESRLNDEELKDLKEMLQIGKVSDQHVESMNQTDYPLQNVYSWIHAKSAEKFDLSLLDQHNLELWNNIFKCQYENTTEQQLHDVVNLLVERYYILQFHPVTYLRQLLRMILTHPNLSQLDKKNLQCLKKSVGFNSEDILAISKSEPSIFVPSYLSEMCYPYGEKLSII